MEIQVLNHNEVDGKVEVTVTYLDSIDDLGHIARVTVWVKATDSLTELRTSAIRAARSFLSLALDHDSDAGGQ